MSKHTPGPWRITGDGHHIVPDIMGPTDCAIAEMVLGPHREANAAVIAAAPDMLEALKFALTPLDALADGRPRDAERFIKRAAAVVAYAIAKAEGQSS